MTKKKKLVKKALKNPELHSPAELQYFKLWLAKRKQHKKEKELKSSTQEA